MEYRKKPATSAGFINISNDYLLFFNMLNQTLTFTHLGRRQRITFIRKRVFPSLN